MIFERIRSHLGLAQIVFREGVGIHDENSVGFEVGDVHFQRRGVHGDQNVNGVTGRVDVVGSEMKLITADAGERAGRSTNFGGEVGESGDVVAVEGDGGGEL